MTGLLGNFLGGWLATKWKMNRLMSIALLLMTVGLLGLTAVSTKAHVTMVAAVMGLAGGFVTVLFFAFWRAVYGTKNLGQIQGAAQTLTVLASAVGPLVLAACVARTGSYAIAFYLLAAVVTVLALAAWFVRAPDPSAG
jgi:cyanate permease